MTDSNARYDKPDRSRRAIFRGGPTSTAIRRKPAPILPSLPSQGRPDGEILHELTRSICPECRVVIDAEVLLRDGQVYMRKRCEVHGWLEGLIYADARAYVDQAEYNKRWRAPIRISTEVLNGCPLVALIEGVQGGRLRYVALVGIREEAAA